VKNQSHSFDGFFVFYAVRRCMSFQNIDRLRYHSRKFRVGFHPLPVVSIVGLSVTLRREVTVAEINVAFRKAAESGPLQGILGYSDEPLVSCDYRGDPRSSIIDGLSTLVIGGKLVKILAWYDNEWGFSNRLADLTLLMEKRGL
jgi:glyceraldehyde 3-phosphate dehydrogenase